jgi:hypothetical protein
MKRDARLIRLSREHTQALMLALRIRREAPQADVAALGALFSQLVAFWSAGLLPHFTAESECLLARLVRHVPAQSTEVRRLQDDHLLVETLIAAMRDTDDHEQRRTLLLELGETLRVHVRWEEETLFPLTEALLLTSELDALGSDLAARLPEHPLPWDGTAG